MNNTFIKGGVRYDKDSFNIFANGSIVDTCYKQHLAARLKQLQPYFNVKLVAKYRLCN